MQQHIVAVLLVCVYGSYTSLHFLLICFLHSIPTYMETRLQNTAQRCYRGSKLQTTDTETHSSNSFQLIRKRVACLIRFCMDVPGLLWSDLLLVVIHHIESEERGRWYWKDGWPSTTTVSFMLHLQHIEEEKKNSVNYRQTD